MAIKNIEKMSTRELRAELSEARRLLKVGLEIHDEYLSQIATCVSQDYGRLNQFPLDCAQLGIKLNADT